MKKNEIPPTRGRESLGLPSPRDVPRAYSLRSLTALGTSLGKPMPCLAQMRRVLHSRPLYQAELLEQMLRPASWPAPPSAGEIVLLEEGKISLHGGALHHIGGVRRGSVHRLRFNSSWFRLYMLW